MAVIEVWCDGSSSGGADKPGGWGWVIAEDGVPVADAYGGHPHTTNNVMELEALAQGIWALRQRYGAGVKAVVVSDSQYALRLATGEYTPSKNVDLAKRVRAVFAATPGLTARHVRGHTGLSLNEAADMLAKMGKEAQNEGH